MSSDKKRVNLTVPDEIYNLLQLYKEDYSFFTDASVCLHLIVKQLNRVYGLNRKE